MKPEVTLTGTDGNVFAIIGNVSRALKDAGKRAEAKNFTDRAFLCCSYDEVIQLAMEYVEIR